MILRYTGGPKGKPSEVVPQLGQRTVFARQVVPVRNEHVARELLDTGRWEEFQPAQPKTTRKPAAETTRKTRVAPATAQPSKHSEERDT